MSKNRKITGNIVYSTNQDLVRLNEADEQIETLPPQDQNLRVWIDRKQRKGKAVTLITGFAGSDEAMNELARMLKTKCGTGGSAKDGEIIIQGEMREKVLEILKGLGYRAKAAGG
ncbi:MAG: translation initiation factor [Sphingobacteriia bacterium]|nr:translation initiation factor [Sphingobacteriia bacterium]